MTTNWRPMSKRKARSTRRFATNSPSTRSAGRRNETSKGVTKSVKMSATAVVMSMALALVEARGSTMNHARVFDGICASRPRRCSSDVTKLTERNFSRRSLCSSVTPCCHFMLVVFARFSCDGRGGVGLVPRFRMLLLGDHPLLASAAAVVPPTCMSKLRLFFRVFKKLPPRSGGAPGAA